MAGRAFLILQQDLAGAKDGLAQFLAFSAVALPGQFPGAPGRDVVATVGPQVMGLLELINQLINEHGSATIMGERLNLARDQAQVLEKQLAALVVENAALKQRVAQLEQQVAAQTALE